MKLDLAEIKKRFQIRAALAVTIESGRTIVDYVKREASGFEVVKSFEMGIGADAIVASAEKAGKELGAQLAAAGIRERRCVVCVPASWALTTSTDVPEIAGDDLRGYLELKAEREFPIAVSDLKIAHCTFSEPDGKQRATVAAVGVKRFEAIERMLAAAECRAVSISLGLDACLPQPEMPAAMHFVANGTHVDLVIAAGGGIAAVRSLPAPVDAETFDAGGFSREVRITLGQLPETLRQQVTQARFSGSPVTAENLCLEIRQHLQRFGIESRLQRSSAVNDQPGAALAAAERHLRNEPVAFEFLPPQVNRWEQVARQFEDRRRRWIALAVVAAVLLPIITFFVRSHIESSLNDEWAGMRRKVADLESLQQRIRQFRPWFESSPQSLQIIEGLAAAFPDQGDVWAKSIQVTDGSKVTCSGFARSQSALLAWFDRLRARKDVSALQVQQVRGENPIQFSITYKWEAQNGN
jgi:Tfp pilus assembly protein PilN